MGDLEKVEEALRVELRHVAAPDGFTGRVMQRVVKREPLRKERGKTDLAGVPLTAAWWTAAAATLAMAVGGGGLLHARHQRQMQQAQARAQIDLAMRLTNRALNEAQTDLDRSLTQRFSQLSDGTEK